MSKKALFVALLMLASIVASASAAEKPLEYYPGNYAGNKQYYQVMFDGEGEASVLAKITTLNAGTTASDKIAIEIPGYAVNIKYILQEISKETCSNYCVRWGEKCEKICQNWNATGGTCAQWYDRCSSNECLEYSQSCYASWEKDYVPLEYDKEQLSKSVRLTIKLNQNIETGKTGTILIYYKTQGYAKKFINFDFDFETAKTPYDTSYLRVAVQSDADLYLRGGKTETNYIQTYPVLESATKSAVAGQYLGGGYAQTMRGYSSNIEYANGYIKEKRNLDAWESFHVTGTYNYADVWFLTFIWEIAGIAIVLAVLKYFWKDIRQRFFPKKPAFQNRSENRFQRIAIYGFASAVAIHVIWWATFNLIDQYYYYSNSFSGLFMVAAAIAMLAAFVGPSIYAGSKFGFADGAWTMVSTVVCVFIIAFAVSALSYSPPIYYADVMKTLTG